MAHYVNKKKWGRTIDQNVSFVDQQPKEGAQSPIKLNK